MPTTTLAIRLALIHSIIHGEEYLCGGDPEDEVAAIWAASTLTNAEIVGYTSAYVWTPEAAESLRDAGVSPETAAETPPGYQRTIGALVCNGDIPACQAQLYLDAVPCDGCGSVDEECHCPDICPDCNKLCGGHQRQGMCYHENLAYQRRKQ